MTHDVLSDRPETDRPTGKRILVTGGAGFIGSHLVDALVADNEVRVFDNLSGGSTEFVHNDAELIEGDVRDRTAVAEAATDVDIIYDVVQANLLAGTTDATGTAFNIGTGESISIRGLAEVVQSLGDSSPGIRHESAREGDIDESTADIERAMDELGFEPDYELREGLSTIW